MSALFAVSEKTQGSWRNALIGGTLTLVVMIVLMHINNNFIHPEGATEEEASLIS